MTNQPGTCTRCGHSFAECDGPFTCDANIKADAAKECPSCNRTHERTSKGVRPIKLTREGICAACTDARDEMAAESNAKRKLYKTAVARIGCASFDKGEIVAVKFDHTSNTGVAWYLIDAAGSGPLESPVMYPEHHLTRFVL